MEPCCVSGRLQCRRMPVQSSPSAFCSTGSLCEPKLDASSLDAQSMASCRTNLGSLYGECRINWRLPRGWEMNSPIISRLSLQGGVPTLACQGFRMHASAVKSSHGRHGRKQERVDTTVLSELTESSPSMPLAEHCMTKCKRSLDKLLFVACWRRETETLVRAKAEGTHRRTWKLRVVQLYIDA